MTFVRIWAYRPAAGAEAEAGFAAAYGADGTWVELFRRDAGYLGTELLRAPDGRWLTIDRWRSREHWDAFLSRHRAEYEATDRACAALTAGEWDLGEWSTA
jgi:heme-degrading monooxygenase HmoA